MTSILYNLQYFCIILSIRNEQLLNILKNKNLLLVEDEHEIQKYFRETLEIFFNHIYCANNGEDALRIYYENKIDMIFTDYNMPVMDGYELILELKKINSSIPIVIISNHDDKERLQKCITLGLSGYLFKPLDYNDLKKFLESLSKELLEKNKTEYVISNDCKVNLSSYTISVNKLKYDLTELEVEFLRLLLSHPNSVVTYDTIHLALYRFDLNSNSIKNLVYRLKTKYKFDRIKNVINTGYLLVIDE